MLTMASKNVAKNRRMDSILPQFFPVVFEKRRDPRIDPSIPPYTRLHDRYSEAKGDSPGYCHDEVLLGRLKRLVAAIELPIVGLHPRAWFPKFIATGHRDGVSCPARRGGGEYSKMEPIAELADDLAWVIVVRAREGAVFAE